MSDEEISLRDVIGRAEQSLSRGETAAARVWATGFDPLDTYLGGGLRAGELTLLGGQQGLGKTMMALQLLRNVVAAGGSGIYFSYEHDEETILERLIGVEGGALGGADGVPLRLIREALENAEHREGGLAARLSVVPTGARAVEAVASYGDRLFVHRSNASTTSMEVIRERIAATRVRAGDVPLVVVDYLQKVAVPDGALQEDERVTVIVEALKDLALEFGVPIVAIVAADREGLVAGRRLRIHNLRGSSALAYEADVVLLLNSKYDVVARHHLVYDVGNAERYRDFAVVSIEKNRSGLDRIDVEFRKRFEQGRYETEGNLVSEQLIDERVFVE